MLHVVMFSGGAGSWACARRVKDRMQDGDRLVLLFADTKMEDEDLYRFLDEASSDVGGELVRVAEGRTPWEVFFDVRFLGNTRVDPCSLVLKRKFLRAWLDENARPEDTVVYLGIDWTEAHRYEKAKPYWQPWRVEAPMCEAPYLNKTQVLDELASRGIAPPRLYEMGFPHNNCGGFCIKAGQAHFRLLLEKMPDRYRFHEQQEERLGKMLGKTVSVLRERSRPKILERLGLSESDIERRADDRGRSYFVRRDNGERVPKTLPLTLAEFRCRLEGGEGFDEYEWGGCGCMSPLENVPVEEEV